MTTRNELRELLAEATPGPWGIDGEDGVTFVVLKNSNVVAEFSEEIPGGRIDAILTAALRNAALGMLDELNRLEAENANQKEALRFYASGQHHSGFDEWEDEEHWLCPPTDEGTMIEDGNCARCVLAGLQPDWEGEPPAVHPCESRAALEGK